jgi:hypothetical protein
VACVAYNGALPHAKTAFAMTFDRYTRWQAASIHLAASAVIAAGVVATMLLLWYPRPYFHAAGGLTLLLLLIGVDVVVGPLLTLIVFDPRKKHLVFDLAVIAMLQFGALAYGVMIMFNARPVYVAFAGDRFELVEANAIDPANLAKASPAFRELPLTGPKIVGSRLPANPRELDDLRMATLFGVSIGTFPQHFVPYASQSRQVVAQAEPLAKLRGKHPEGAAEIDRVVGASGKTEAELRYLPLQARLGDMAVIVDGTSGAVQGVAAVDPW